MVRFGWGLNLGDSKKRSLHLRSGGVASHQEALFIADRFCNFSLRARVCGGAPSLFCQKVSSATGITKAW